MTHTKTNIEFTVSDNKKINNIAFESFKIAYIFNRTKCKVCYLHYCVSKSVIDELKKLDNVTVTLNKNFDSDNKDADAYKYDIRINTASYDTVMRKLVALLNADAKTAQYIDRLTATKTAQSKASADAKTASTAKSNKTASKSNKTAQSTKTANKTDSADAQQTAQTA